MTWSEILLNFTAYLYYSATFYRSDTPPDKMSADRSSVPPSSAPDSPLSEQPPPPGKMMVDPFEVRMRFTAQLQHLSASVTSSQKAAHYALKYRDLDEDLHSCILEQLERVGFTPLLLEWLILSP